MPVYTQIAQKILDEIALYNEQKDALDSIVNLSKEEKTTEKLSVEKREGYEGYMTLLSEGSILYSDGTIRLYISKGTLKKWYDSIDETFEGYVTTGHVDLNSFPVREGYFRKADLKLVTDEDGRSDLLVKPHVNLELSNIKDLLIQNEPFAISSEFVWYDMAVTDDLIEEYTKLVVYNVEHGGSIDVNITDNIHIMGFSFVGNPGNARSGGYEPSMLKRNEEEHLKNKEILEKVLAKLSTEVEGAITEVTEDTTQEETSEVEVPAETEQAEEPVKEEEAEVQDDVTEMLASAISRIEALEAEKAGYAKENEELKKKVAEYEASEQGVAEQLSKLEKLLSKGNVKVEDAKETLGKSDKTANIFGRTRFGG